ncbi:class I SAM-dependent methyltransferase [Actinoplanes sp. LDG1-06]|uniref:Class I SAM-dependent methyltransferase n=1 Tax=Paractinoplanes ovalisporus TaxID=2810368 RepID=A0ABS2A971_9ACTN|nr:class I SAM-dependent methyltransferase [Actinoplanes ovalisporus]MBM2615863.1 class I SAM-dependent methyltransferase [Actinoplanes ovalisporus]
MTTLTSESARRLLRQWDRQQTAYVAHRENRFTVMLDVLELHLDSPTPRVLDLACGPGAISQRVLAAFPGATVTAVDYDPVLLRIAALATGVRAIDVDLAAPGWPSLVGPVDAVLSSTALHWLSPADLLAVYRDAASLLPPGGLLMNADHLRYDDRSPALRAVSERHDARTQADDFAAGALDYAGWYELAAAEPELAALMPVREKRFADRPPQPLAPLEFHLAALRAAGFRETGTVWQYLDDYVVFARK